MKEKKTNTEVLQLEDVEKNCEEFAKNNDLKLTFFQSNIEGELVEKIQISRKIKMV